MQGLTSRVMICDSQQSFEFSWLNNLLSWAFSWQDKKIEIINGSVKFERYLNTLITMLIMSLCLVLIISILLTTEPANFKKSYSGFPKNMIKPPLPWLVFWLSNYLAFDGIKCAFTKCTTHKSTKKPQSASVSWY